mmetsp:Transcript_49171/g.91621  ORF Transcript_49171/g.91621 Transcript_49171/m.91621 type:complete len:298 (+) Transcript_49171:49-942(+)
MCWMQVARLKCPRAQNSLEKRLAVHFRHTCERSDANTRYHRRLIRQNERSPPTAACIDADILGSAPEASGKVARRFLKLAAATDRGAATPKTLLPGLTSCIEELESLARPEDLSLDQLDGAWVLVWSSVEAPERTSPLFWAVQAFTDSLTQPGASSLIFRLTDALKGPVGMQCGAIKQTITTSAQLLVSEVVLTVSPVPGVQLSGTVTTSARASAVGNAELELKVLDTKVVGSPIPFIDKAKFPVETAFEQLAAAHRAVRGGEETNPELVILRTTFVDGSIRVSRNENEDVFVYIRA